MNERLLKATPVIISKLFSGAREIVDKAGTVYSFKEFVGGKVRYCDIAGYRFITQNPEKNSEWGLLARRGAQIAWVINLETNEWLARTVNGKVQLLSKKA